MPGHYHAYRRIERGFLLSFTLFAVRRIHHEMAKWLDLPNELFQYVFDVCLKNGTCFKVVTTRAAA